MTAQEAIARLREQMIEAKLHEIEEHGPDFEALGNSDMLDWAASEVDAEMKAQEPQALIKAAIEC